MDRSVYIGPYIEIDDDGYDNVEDILIDEFEESLCRVSDKYSNCIIPNSGDLGIKFDKNDEDSRYDPDYNMDIVNFSVEFEKEIKRLRGVCERVVICWGVFHYTW